jgi:hypothetical protein
MSTVKLQKTNEKTKRRIHQSSQAEKEMVAHTQAGK